MDGRNQMHAAAGSYGNSASSLAPPAIMLQTTQILDLTRDNIDDHSDEDGNRRGGNPGSDSDDAPTETETETESVTPTTTSVAEGPPRLTLQPTLILSLTANGDSSSSSSSSSREVHDEEENDDDPTGEVSSLMDKVASLQEADAQAPTAGLKSDLKLPQQQLHVEAENMAVISRIMQVDKDEAEKNVRATKPLLFHGSSEKQRKLKPGMSVGGQPNTSSVPGATRVYPSSGIVAAVESANYSLNGWETTPDAGVPAPPLQRGRRQSRQGAFRVNPAGREEVDDDELDYYTGTDYYYNDNDALAILGGDATTTAGDSMTVQGRKVNDLELEEEIRQRIVDQAVTASIRKEFWTRGKVLGLVVCLVAAIGAIIGGILATRQNRPSDQITPTLNTATSDPTGAPSYAPTVFPSAAPSLTPYSKEILELIKNWNPEHGKALEDPSSPQYKAFTWMISRDQSQEKLQLLQRYALATLYFATGGEDWFRQDLWLKEDIIACDWSPAIFCNLSLNVANLELPSNNLQGTIPPELGYLTELNVINLQGNFLSGSVPTSLTILTKLWTMNVMENALTGTLPISDKETELIELQLASNSFSGTLSALLGSLGSLEKLDISDNPGITGSIPQEMMKLTRLEQINLSRLSLTGVLPPSIISSLTNLQTLNLHSSGVGGPLPTFIGHLTRLNFLDISSNHFSGALPEELSLLSSLSELYISDNPWNGTIPDFVTRLSSLEILEIVHTRLTSSLPTTMALMQDLSVFSCRGNQMTGTLPTEIGLMTNLEELRITETFLTGSLPSEMGQLAFLRKLKLDSNQFSGKLPMQFDDLESLSEFSVLNNSFTGTIPESFVLLESLVGASFAVNNFTGLVPFCNEDETTSLGVLVRRDCMFLLYNLLYGWRIVRGTGSWELDFQ